MEAFSTGQLVVFFAALGALLCTVVAVVMKPLNLGLFENMAVGAASGGLAAYTLCLFQVEPLALMVVLQLLAILGPMVILGLWLNARAR
ncbi:MAG: hypothetical protein AAF700_13385 [Pseudomonadota bacterium]